MSQQNKKIYQSISDCIGNTPLVELHHLAKKGSATILGKIENMNPLWSVKDRLALAMINTAEQDGSLKAGGIVIEATSGNTGIGLASICASRGYRLLITMPESMSIERRRLLQALGAELILTPAAEGMPGAIRHAEKLLAENKDYFMPKQFENPANVVIHQETTGEEIWRDTAGEVDILIAGVGTGGTITGAGSRLKEYNSNLQVIAVEPSASPVMTQAKGNQMLVPGKHKIQGIGAGFIPSILNLDLIDEVVTVHDDDATSAARQVAKGEGILCGISSGAAAWAAGKVAQREENAGKTIVVILPDTGERYISTDLYSS